MIEILCICLIDLDSNELINYRHTIIRMLFDRWQHCRQMSYLARNIFNLSSMAEANNESFITDMSTLISNIAYLTSMIELTPTITVSSREERSTKIIWISFSLSMHHRFN